MDRKATTFLVVITLLLAPLTAAAQLAKSHIITGATLDVMLASYQKLIDHDPALSSTDLISGSAGIGYVEGVMDAEDGKAFCLPPLSQREVTAIVRKYHAQIIGLKGKQPAEQDVVMALSARFPCKADRVVKK